MHVKELHMVLFMCRAHGDEHEYAWANWLSRWYLEGTLGIEIWVSAVHFDMHGGSDTVGKAWWQAGLTGNHAVCLVDTFVVAGT